MNRYVGYEYLILKTLVMNNGMIKVSNVEVGCRLPSYYHYVTGILLRDGR